MSRSRQQKHSEEIKNSIIEIARKIIAEEGPDAVSIRRITKEMDYSPGIVYHYFDSKEDIILHVLKENYQRILSSIKPPRQNCTPEETIRSAVTNYIDNALSFPLEYRSIMLSSSPDILNFTSVLEKGISEKRPAFMQLVACIKRGIAEGVFVPDDAELTAQAIWSAMFGLLIRIIIEGNITPDHQKMLISHQIEIILRGIRL